MWKLVLAFSLLATLSVKGQILQNGQCDENINLQNNFNMEQFADTWYDIRSAETPWSGDCAYFEFQIFDTGAIAVTHSTVRQNFLQTTSGTGSLVPNTARLSLTMPQLSNTDIDFWVITTDYQNFALAYGCQNVGNTQRNVFIWQLSRTESFAFPLTSQLLNQIMYDAVGLTNNDLRDTSHTGNGCFILPIIQPGEPVIIPGQCNQDITGVANFNVPGFLGVWHQIAAYQSENANGTCNRAQYSDGDGVVNVVNSEIVDQELRTISGSATLVGTSGNGHLNVTLEILPGVFVDSELKVLATDYTRWAISYTCVDIGEDSRQIFSWILSRTRVLPAQAQAEVNQVISSYIELNDLYYQTTDQSQTGCFYVPTPVLNQPVVFGGQCDQNIAVVTDFDATQYLGIWHDIESYPNPFQAGTCSTAEYSLGDGVVIVYNTQVVNQTLDEIYGTAVQVGNDAKLVVTFPIAGTDETTNTDYWVIATDYDSYSLVYSCSNINDYQQQVTVWKLSRSKSLTNQTEINEAMSQVPVIDQQFFEVTDQTPGGCYFVPEPTGEVVRFPGQCEDVPAIEDFDFTRFIGQWFEVSSYPVDDQPRQCVSHQFVSTGNNAMTVATSSVNDQLMVVSQGQLTRINATSTAAAFDLNIIGQNPVSIPYYIIATDYENYALAYSCVEDGDYFKKIYAWKLGRTTQLSAQHEAAIATAAADIDVIREEYFEPTLHTEYACYFFPPNLNSGDPVILGGQCSEDIPVMQNFDAGRYLGRWRLIESYPSDNQQGTCNEAYYELNETEVIVQNSEVRNQTLSQDIGVAVLENATVGQLSVTFPGAPEPVQLYVLDTDYQTYSLVFACINLDTNSFRVYSWKMSRAKSLIPEAVNAIAAIVDTITVLNNRYYEVIDHSDDGCFYLPPPGSSIVIFPGQCDQTIPVVTDFNITGYLNLWYDVASYPLPFQDGTCPNAFYSLGDDGVDVYNTQVIDQRLDTIRGVAVLANETSSEAKLLVNFPSVGNQTSNYWVLATDYVDYALVYSCENLDEERRQVSSWKLSRSKSLSAAATTAMNVMINIIPVLDDRYYIERDQTPDGCFYFPDPEPGKPVEFPGACDMNIAVVQNFDLQRFEGVWHEIEAYPKEQQQGDCIRHEFTLQQPTNNSFGLQSFNVIAESLGITDGVVSFSSNDNSARFTITFTSNTTSYTIPYWIIDTDYDNYALAYSCVNRDDIDYRGVFSWKLSRTKTLPLTYAQRIEEAMADIDVIDQRYFETIDQNDDACFYFPDLAPGEPVVFPGQCDANITVVPNFDAGRYLGRWKLIEHYPSDFQLGTCGEAEYSLGSSGEVIVRNTEVINETLSVDTAVAEIIDNGKLLVQFPNAPYPSELWVLDTDYDTYSIVYSCSNINPDERRVFSWKLSKTDNLNAIANEAINAVLDRVNVLDQRFYVNVDRTPAGCFYFPIPDGNPVRFRAQCDESIPVVTGFDPEAYGGLWHDLASYPIQDQNGECPNAYYTLGDNGVDVFNTQVVNQTLDTIRGVAILANASSDEAKLLVNFPTVGPFYSNYWVLSTDYTSYSFVYSCYNIDDEYMQVFSWKLSRTKELSANATAEINSIIDSIPVLSDQYYLERDQSDEACFYFPEVEVGKPVEFPGRCDENATVVQNFDLNRFEGVWHEIEAYPKEQQQGDCIRHEFTVQQPTNNSFGLQSFNVIAESLGITDGVVSFSSNDNSARFTITFTSNTTSYTIPYWIIDTDYDNYALAYSCVNRDDIDYRGVFSWKLSRTKTLPLTYAQRIEEAMADIDVIDQRYFEIIDQNDDACFYFPDLAPGEPVVFPGQCDANITVVPNFDAGRYLGRWKLIEHYPSDFQLGTCGEAEYSLGSSGEVIVRNTEVINETLSVDTAVAEIIDNGKLLVQFPNAPNPSELWVLDTDYDTYSIVYSCSNINSDERRVFSWKLSKTDNLNAIANEAINAVLDRVNVLDQRFYVNVDRTPAGCFYFPVPDGNPVRFRAQCDESIPVVTGFDPEAYGGLWHDLASYPIQDQNGECPNAYYTLGDNGVDVFNTQVVNQTLDTIRGVAILANASSDEAKLLVNFPTVGPFYSNYWVLSTDYTSYSFVYSCYNIDDEYMQVFSWKLSRTKELTANATAEINSIIDSIPVLSDQYYLERDQSDEACFYFPEVEVGKPVEFPGRCDENATVVQNFDLNRFEGVWHEIEAYPKEQQQGDCIRHEFTVQQPTNNSFGLQSFNVIAESLGITDGVVSFSSNDNSARFTITFTSNTTSYTIPYWIIDTDYDNYALAYSCVNRDDIDYRGVFSWKLSRTKTLPLTYAQRIEEAMADIDVIDQRYFEIIDQNDDACFYFPDLAPGEPVVFPGQCDANITVVPNFDAGRYLGRWKLIEHYPSDFQLGTCGEAEYSLGSSGEVIVRNTEVINETLSVDTAVAEIIDNGKLLVQFPNAPNPSELWVLDTDYDTYSIVYSCSNINSDERRVFSWKLSRTDNLNAIANEAINAVLDRVNVLDQRFYVNVDRTPTGCFYFPVPDGNPVRFRAQCDESIPVVTGFDPEAYGGLWYDLASYPIQDQNGECPNAHYTLGDNGVDVFNTQVVNQTLDTIRGVAILANVSSDEAKLLVNFPTVGPFYSNYWVLSTDYTSYSFVYSCYNIDDEYMQVFSWKLSRTKELTANATAEINSIIDSIPVLSDQYYLERDQTDDACFYFPEVVAGRPVEFPGRCDENATVVQNFDLNRFQGQWFELETYPKEQQTGQCISHEFTVSGNSFQLQSFSVQNEAIDVTSGVVTFTSGDNSARFVITIQVNGSTIEIPYWIVDTDYENYALAYSCVDVVDERGVDMRAVYSWKLSRTRQLLPSSIQAINNALSNNDVLDNRYYENVDHTDDGCFILPDLAPGEPVVFGGQCDPSLSVVSNFDASKYLGTWNLIETYPSNFQVGTCADATYSLDVASDTVTVYNTEVVNETLSTMTGSATVIGDGKLSVIFPDSQPIEYWIMDTDYDSYSIVYSCVNINPEQRRVYSWKLSRTQSLTNNAVTAINAVLNRVNVLNQRYYVEVDRTDESCFYYPEPSDNPTVFRGTCDPNVDVVPNFDAARYLGTWNLIENYPSAFQLGTCADATYSLATDGSVTVVNTEVRNQTLAVDTGRAVVIGNGKLEVTFPDAPAPIEYWVIDTDYDSYSVVYSCVNLENNRRSVFSWKLSRTNIIENTAVAAVNAAIDRVQVLDQRYYKTVDRSDDGCFYYPEPNGTPVVLPGQCDDDIPVVMDFDISRYEGTWYQIERYPQPFEDPNSNCVGARYTFDEAAGVVNLINWEVVDDELQYLEGTATLASDDGSAKLTVVLPVVGTDDTTTTSLYVLATDYDSYSLAYSCSNLEGNRRSIGAWKLSRTRSLPAEANSAIDTVIADRSELRQEYFISIEQNEECPEPSSGVFVKSSIIVVLLCLLVQHFV